ncbi:MAG: hypothetical protein HYY79_05240 [Betaproteobacteria bacterium]|nr:hypothetical protein [Betaproteobacteria bacterium]
MLSPSAAAPALLLAARCIAAEPHDPLQYAHRSTRYSVLVFADHVNAAPEGGVRRSHAF